jgi:hypothetical protein
MFPRSRACLVLILSMLWTSARAETGLVKLKPSTCDYFLIQTPSGHVLAEWFGGYDPSRGDNVIGSFNTYGFVTVFYGNAHLEGKIYIEDYWLDSEDAIEKLSEQCQ